MTDLNQDTSPVAKNFTQVDAGTLSEFANVSTANISDNLERLPGCVGLIPFHKISKTMAGAALTVRVAAGDNYAFHKALELVRPGDVIVVDGGGALDRALAGEIMMNIALSRGAAGFVIDGAIRDAAIIAKGNFPCFARAAIHRGPYKNGPGEINVPVSVGGMVISPGDIVVGDQDGVVAFAPSNAKVLLERVRAQEAKEKQILLSIREGRYTGSYAR